MSKSPFQHLDYGTTLLTPQTRRWTKKQFVENDKIESAMIFDSFDVRDQGRSRKLICKMETSDQRWVAWRDYIIESVNLREALERQLTEAKESLSVEIEAKDKILEQLKQRGDQLLEANAQIEQLKDDMLKVEAESVDLKKLLEECEKAMEDLINNHIFKNVIIMKARQIGYDNFLKNVNEIKKLLAKLKAIKNEKSENN